MEIIPLESAAKTRTEYARAIQALDANRQKTISRVSVKKIYLSLEVLSDMKTLFSDVLEYLLK